MLVKNIDMFRCLKKGDAICVTTNGIVKKNKRLVMGSGVAKEFKNKFKNIDLILGQYVSKYGNRAFNIGVAKNIRLFSFPTKQDYRQKSSLKLIKQSAIQLTKMVNKFNVKGDIYIPAPGCGKGKLNFEDVSKCISNILKDDKYIICYKNFYNK